MNKREARKTTFETAIIMVMIDLKGFFKTSGVTEDQLLTMMRRAYRMNFRLDRLRKALFSLKATGRVELLQFDDRASRWKYTP